MNASAQLRAFLAALAVTGALVPSTGSAQQLPPGPAETNQTADDSPVDPAANPLTAAAREYDSGARAYLAGRYVDAAEAFERAFGYAPAAAALVQALRAWNRADVLPRAARVAVILRARYPQVERAAVNRVLRHARRALVRADVTCVRCAIEVDGELIGSDSATFFFAPGTEPQVVGRFLHGRTAQRVQGAQGATLALTLETPREPPSAVAVAPPIAAPPEPTPPRNVTPPQAPAGPPPPPRRPPSTTAMIRPDVITAGLPAQRNDDTGGADGTGLALTVGLGAGLSMAAIGTLIWSGLDTLSGAEAYRLNPTEEGLRDGQERETRTNILIGVTAGVVVGWIVSMGIAAAVTSDRPSAAPRVSVAFDERSFGVTVGGAL